MAIVDFICMGSAELLKAGNKRKIQNGPSNHVV